MDINRMKSDLRMDGLHFPECTVTRNAIIENGELFYDLEKQIHEMEDGSYTVVLTLTIRKEKADLFVKVVASAKFTMDNDDPKLKQTIMNNNAVAIMFPFIRSQVTLLTTQPGMSPIVLPPINTARFVK